MDDARRDSNFPAMPSLCTAVKSPSLIFLPARARGNPAATTARGKCQIAERDGWL